jgi:hypothetical protein
VGRIKKLLGYSRSFFVKISRLTRHEFNGLSYRKISATGLLWRGDVETLAKDHQVVARRIEIADNRLLRISASGIEAAGRRIIRRAGGFYHQQAARLGLYLRLHTAQQRASDAALVHGRVDCDPV